ncbi:O-antigen ligase family protein [Sphingobium yanoikuyae]|uniref:O-antigen ligase-related domain-containing protein n=1 Tax=Sphingobium yanoikuyae TaxID=13690 RepID=A0A291N699_SPHYA|nr:O-antigen ligase family protein [Sphingobium yanoikuyae]ATI82924.1 hypothetical protein A6768_24935 [Sphingobium yanoikuyae]
MTNGRPSMRPSLTGWRRSSALLLLGIAIILGGGGVRYALMNAAVQLAALALLAVRPACVRTFWQAAPTGLRILLIATLALPAIQLVPLPPALWQALPGRDLVAESLALAGSPGLWMPLSLDPGRTLVALVGLTAPAILLLLAMDSGKSERALILPGLAALGLASLVLGAGQLISARQALNWFPGGNPHQLYGSFANHNSSGLFLVIALCAAIAIPTPARPARQVIKLATCLLLTMGVLLTQSRSSIMLLILPAIQWLLALGRHQSFNRARRTAILAAAMTIALAGFAVIAMNNARLSQAFDRFDSLHDARGLIWQDSLIAIGRYWPIGSGMGTFDEVFQIDESIENVNRHRAGRAHNDLLELVLESGLAGAILCLGWIAYIGRLTIPLLRDNEDRVTAPAIILIAILLQSFIDYPLRNQAILCIAASMIALIASESKRIRMK